MVFKNINILNNLESKGLKLELIELGIHGYDVKGSVIRSNTDHVLKSKSFSDYESAKEFFDEKKKIFFKKGRKGLENVKCDDCGFVCYSNEEIITCENCSKTIKQENKNYW